MNFRFQHIEYFLALAALPLLVLLFWYLLRWKKNTIQKIGEKRLVTDLIRNHSNTKFLTKFLLVILAFIAIILGAANLRRPGAMNKIDRKGVDVLIALDVSKSMLAEDIKPNRLEMAKQFINKLLEHLEDDRVGLILFAGRAYMQMPLTVDHAAASLYLQSAGPETVPTQGTLISEALRMSNNALNSLERKYKAIVLITDGEDHDPESVKIAAQLSANAIMINTVGIGSPEGVPIPDGNAGEFKKDEQGSTVVSKLNEAELQQLALITKGVYVRLNDPNDAVTAIIRQLSTIEATELEDAAFKDFIEYFQWFIAAALLLLIAEFFLAERKSIKNDSR